MRKEKEAMNASKIAKIVWNVLLSALVIYDNILFFPDIPSDITAPVTWNAFLLILTDMLFLINYVIRFAYIYAQRKVAKQNTDNA